MEARVGRMLVGDKAVQCPHCTQWVKLYRRSITSPMAEALIALFRLNRTTRRYYHITDIMPNRHPGDFAKLVYWGLIEEQPKAPNKDTRTSGYWRITEQGDDFVNRRVRVQKYVRVFDSRVYGFEGELADIAECLSNAFSYQELMA